MITAERLHFIRYPGGKQRITGQIVPYLPKKTLIKGRFVEPFLGGGAVFFLLEPRHSILADINDELITLYRGIRLNPIEVWDIFKNFASTKEAYYRVRDANVEHQDLAYKAARTLYLNRTCFKGMWRHNARGQFNVGYGGQLRRWVINEVEFSGDLNNFVSAHKYLVYAPNEELLNLITNSMVPKDNRFVIGDLRLTECRLPLPNKPQPHVPVFVSTKDFMGTRTSMFGKTRLGKSNVVKLIAQSLIETTLVTKNVGQLIFDINGEYANDNPQDDSSSLKSGYSERCEVYALTKKENTDSKPLRLNFYENPESSHKIIATLLKEAGKDTSIYISSFLSVDIPPIESIIELPPDEEKKAKRKTMMYWAILHRAGYPANAGKLKGLMGVDPQFNQGVRCSVYGVSSVSQCPKLNSLDALAEEFEKCAEADRGTKLKSTSGKDLFDADDRAILGFLRPVSLTSAGVYVSSKSLRPAIADAVWL